jgi:hypothetical protein
MTHLSYTFATVRKIVEKAGLSGLWQCQSNRRWRFAVTENAGLQWSPTRAKLSFYGPAKEQEELQAAVEKILQQDLIASRGGQNAGLDLEEIQSIPDLVGWLIQYMQAGQKCDYPKPLVDCAKMLVREFAAMDDDDTPAFLMWSPPPCLGSSFHQLTPTCATSSYSSMLMDWAGRIYDELSLAELPPENALEHTIEAAGLEDHFRQREKKGKVWLVSRRKFEERFGFRVRIELASSIW